MGDQAFRGGEDVKRPIIQGGKGKLRGGAIHYLGGKEFWERDEKAEKGTRSPHRRGLEASLEENKSRLGTQTGRREYLVEETETTRLAIQ